MPFAAFCPPDSLPHHVLPVSTSVFVPWISVELCCMLTDLPLHLSGYSSLSASSSCRPSPSTLENPWSLPRLRAPFSRASSTRDYSSSPSWLPLSQFLSSPSSPHHSSSIPSSYDDPPSLTPSLTHSLNNSLLSCPVSLPASLPAQSLARAHTDAGTANKRFVMAILIPIVTILLLPWSLHSPASCICLNLRSLPSAVCLTHHPRTCRLPPSARSIRSTQPSRTTQNSSRTQVLSSSALHST